MLRMKTRRQKVEEAQQRQGQRDKRSDKDQLALLESRGHGHCKEAKRLREKIAKEEAG